MSQMQSIAGAGPGSKSDVGHAGPIPIVALGLSLSLFFVISYVICIAGYLLVPGFPVQHAALWCRRDSRRRCAPPSRSGRPPRNSGCSLLILRMRSLPRRYSWLSSSWLPARAMKGSPSQEGQGIKEYHLVLSSKGQLPIAVSGCGFIS